VKIHLKGKRVAVEKIKKHQKTAAHGGIIVPESEEYLGIIRLVSQDADPSLQIGTKVYFSTNYQQSRMNGIDLCVMDDKEIFATVED
jgi:co-chaperonin GroES (HSP10)